MKRALFFLLFAFSGVAPLFAQDHVVLADNEELFKSNDFEVRFSYEMLGEIGASHVTTSLVFIVTPKFDSLVLIKVKASHERRAVPRGFDNPGSPGYYRVLWELVILMYLTDAGNRPELFVVSGENVAAGVAMGLPELKPFLRAINNSLMVAEVENQIKDEKAFLKKVEPAMVFAQQLIEEAESCFFVVGPVKKELSEKLTRQIPGYLDFDAAAWGLVPVPEEKE